MKRTIALILAMLLALSAFGALAAGKGVKIDKKHFTDPAFRKYVRTNFDKDDNGYLSKAEANKVRVLKFGEDTDNDFAKVYCKSLKGIEYFPNLDGLYIEGTKKKRYPLTALDLSKNTKIDDLGVAYANISSLDLGTNKELVNLVVSHTNIKKLDVSRNTELLWVFVNNNKKLSALTFAPNAKLQELECYDNRIRKLNLTGCGNLGSLICRGNRLKSLNLSQNTILTHLDCSGNRNLKKLDIGKCKKLLNIFKKGKKNIEDDSVRWKKGQDNYPSLCIPAVCTLLKGNKVLYEGK